MDYNSLTHAIPKKWTKNVQSEISIRDLSQCILVKEKWMNIKDLACKDVYWDFIADHCARPASITKWEKYLNVHDLEWSKHFVIPFEACRETHIQSFQYKILHRFFPCQYTLSLWYKEENAKCKSCNEIDYLEHYFYSCTPVNNFWKMVEKWWLTILGTSVALSAADVLLGIANFHNDDFINILNFCILYGKWYISRCKKDGVNISFIDYIKLLKDKLKLEEIESILNGDNIFEYKWSQFYNSF